MGVVSRRWVCVESMGVASGCGCKEVYRFPHIIYPYSCICSFLQQHSTVRGVFRGGRGWHSPPLEFQILNFFNECMMYNSLFTII